MTDPLDLDALEAIIDDDENAEFHVCWTPAEAKALIAEVRRLRERYEPKDARWNMGYAEWLQCLNTAQRWAAEWQSKAEELQAEIERRAKVEKEPKANETLRA